jgi:hypothetical protein
MDEKRGPDLELIESSSPIAGNVVKCYSPCRDYEVIHPLNCWKPEPDSKERADKHHQAK